MIARRPVDRALLLLAAGNFKDFELRELLRDLRAASPMHLYKLIKDLQATLSTHRASGLSHRRIGHRIERELGTAGTVESLVNRVDQLLRHDAGLSIAEARSALLSEIGEERLSPNLRRPPPRPSTKWFHQWLARLATVVAPSEILHHATRVRSLRVHTELNDWPLRDRG